MKIQQQRLLSLVLVFMMMFSSATVSFGDASSSNALNTEQTSTATQEQQVSGEETLSTQEDAAQESTSTATGSAINANKAGNRVLRTIIVPGDTKFVTVKFHSDGTLFYEETVKSGEEIADPGVPEKVGFRFDGWIRSDQSTYTDFPVTYTVTEDTEYTFNADFTAVWNVTFVDGSNNVVAVKTVKQGQSVSIDDVTFELASDESIVGWSEDGAEPSLLNPYTPTADITLKPIIKKGNWITYDGQGGTYTAPGFVATGNNTVAPPEPTKYGFTFNHWSDAVGGSAFTFGNSLSTDITLYAVWTPDSDVTYRVFHMLENADDEDYSFEDVETLTGTPGQFTNATANTYDGFTAEAISQQEILGNGSTIVYVYYQRNEYDVLFYEKNSSNDWVVIDDNTIHAKHGADISGLWPGGKWSITANSNTWQANILVMPLGGEDFYKTSQGNYVIKFFYYVEVLPGETGVVPGSGCADPSLQYVLHHTDAFTSGYGTYSTPEDRYPIEGFTYDGYYTGNENLLNYTNGSESYKYLNFSYTRNNYQLKFVNAGDGVVQTENVPFKNPLGDYDFTPTAPAGIPNDYTFQGWFDNSSFAGSTFDFVHKIMPSNNVTLYAKWAPPTYTVNIYVQVQGSGSSPAETHTVDIGSNLETEINGVAANISGFLGWHDEAGNLFNPKTLIYHDYNIYPYIGDGTSYQVCYDANGASGTVPVDSNSYLTSSQVVVMAPTNLVAPTGKRFAGWNTQANGSGDNYNPSESLTINNSDVTLYAQWSSGPEATTLTYYPNFTGSTQSSQVINLPNNGQHTVLGSGTFTRSGYTLIGWSNDSNATTSTYSFGQVIRVDNIDPETNKLYAVWQACNAELMYVANNGTSPEQTDTETRAIGVAPLKSISTLGFTAPTGYTFDKWTTDRAGINTPSYGDGADFNLPAGGATLYAQWKVDTSDTVNIYFKSSDTTRGTVSNSGGAVPRAGAAPCSTANATSGYQFINWTDENGNEVSDQLLFTPVKVNGLNVAATYTANFGISAQFYLRDDNTIVYEDGTTQYPPDQYYPTEPGFAGAIDKAQDFYFPTHTFAEIKANILVEPSVDEIMTWLQTNKPATYNEHLAAYNAGTLEVIWYVIKSTDSGDWHVDGILNDTSNVLVSYIDSSTDPDTELMLTYVSSGVNFEVGEKPDGGFLVPERVGYTFTGWNTKEDGTGTAKSNQDTWSVTEDTTLYAQWQKNVVVFTAKSGTKVYNGGEQTVTGYTHTAGSVTFVGISASGSGTNVGNYAVTFASEPATVTGSDGKVYSASYVNGNLEITKAPASGLELTGEGYRNEYDGEYHTVSASSTVAGTTITYSVDGTNWSNNPPQVKDVNVLNNNNPTVIVKAENDNYETAQIMLRLDVLPR